MIIDRSAEKLMNAIYYFLANIHNCGKDKLYRLLFFVDFKHFHQIGRGVTGLDYHAEASGPVPVDLDRLIDADISSMANPRKQSSLFGTIDYGRFQMVGGRLSIEPLKTCQFSLFTKREKAIMVEMVKELKTSSFIKLEESIFPGKQVWRDVFQGSANKPAKIPYELVLTNQEKEVFSGIIRENNQFWRDFQ